MFNLEGLKIWWYQQRIKHLKSFEEHTHFNLAYFESVRHNDFMRQEIGLKDMNMYVLPNANPKKHKVTMGYSTDVMNNML